MSDKVTRFAVLNSHPIQYFAPLYAYLNAQPEFEVTALYLSDLSIHGGRDPGFDRDVKWNIDLLRGYNVIFLDRAKRSRATHSLSSLARVWREVRSGRYDVLWLHGHNYAANLIALVAAKTAGLRILMRSETHLGLPRKPIKATLRRPLMAALYRLCDRLLAIGSANAAFYRAMGVPEEKIFLVPYSVDNDRFMKASKLNEAQKAQVRSRYHIPRELPAVLYAAKFMQRKRPLDLLKAVRQLQSECRPFTVVMAGSGELNSQLRAYCDTHALGNVVFTGFINQTELPGLYGASDIFVLPSEHEPWGLTVNEAMCAGLPIVVANEVGCVADLVRDGVNGFTPAVGDIDGLTLALRKLLGDEPLRLRQGEASLARIKEWGYPQCLDGIRLALADLKFRRSGPNIATCDNAESRTFSSQSGELE